MSAPRQLTAAFCEEAAERVAELEATLLELETRPADDELIHRAFRAMHTIKGAAGMFGFEDVAAFTHELETVFEHVRSGGVAVTGELVALALEAKDLVRSMLEGNEGTAAARDRLVAALRRQLPAATPPQGATAAAPPPAPESGPPSPVTYRIRFAPNRDLLLDGTDPLRLVAELRALGTCELVAHTDTIPPLDDLVPTDCCVWWEVLLTTDRGVDAIRDVFIFVEGRCELGVAVKESPDGDPSPPSPDSLRASEETRPALAPARSAAPSATDPRRSSVAAAPESSSIRVAAAKLDRLVDLVGELVIAQARLARIAARHDDGELLSVSEDIDRLSAELRDSTLDVRMVPIGTTFGRFRRVTRDLAAELGKAIDLVTDGAETELDKTVIERLTDPLVHLIRNACDHGIETPEARRAAGKPERGTVRLSAYQSGPSVIVEIRDDGAGLDLAAVRARAVERGLIESDARLSEQELTDLVFRPGFSTAKTISSISGRGVGMDVVRRSVAALRGTVQLESALGAGTTVRVELPLTLAIIEGLLVALGESRYVLPLSAVEECVELTREDVARAHGARLATVRGELVPYVRLRETFALEGDPPDIEQIAIVSAAGARCGLVVDDVIGQQQAVIKSLGRAYRNVRGLAGATILGDGTVALIVDVPAITKGITAEAAA